MRRAWRVGLWLGVLALAACAQNAAPDAAGPSPQEAALPVPGDAEPPAADVAKLRFAMVPKQKDNPVFEYAHGAAEERAEELDVELLWDAPAQNDPVKQAQVVDTFIAQGVDGIAVSCASPEILKQPIDKAVAAGIPVVTFDSDSPDSKRQVFYGIDDEGTGTILGEELVALLPQGGKVALLSGVRGAENLEKRLSGAKAALAKQPSIEVIDTLYCDDDIARSVQLINDTMARHPDLAGWVMVGGWPLFAQNGLSAIQPGRTKVVSVDPLPEAWHWIEDGYVQVCVGQKIFGWGRESIDLLKQLAAGETIERANENGFVDSGVDLVVAAKEGRYADDKYTVLRDYKATFETKAE